MIIGNPGGLAARTQAARPAGAGRGPAAFDLDLAARATDDLDHALEAFEAEARKTPRERCREQIMREWGISQEQIDRLSPQEAKEVDDRIEQEVARRMQTAGPASRRTSDIAEQPDIVLSEGAPSRDALVSTSEALNLRIVPGRSDANGFNFRPYAAS